MNVVFLEAYDGGSHRQFAKELLEKIPFSSTYYGLPPRHWRWRLQGSHFSLSQWANENLNNQDVVFILSSLTDSAAFRGLLKKKLRNCPIITYMHEYQGAYPIKKNIGEKNAKIISREIAPAHHLNQVLSSDLTVFNSTFHRDHAIKEMNQFLKRRGEGSFQLEPEDYPILPIGISPHPCLSQMSTRDIDILWNHRIEYDKNPEAFLDLALQLVERKPETTFAILGDDNLKVFQPLLRKYPDNILAQGFISKEQYWQVLHRCKLAPITSFHDFQGLSLLEAMSVGVIPIAPRRMVYPEHLMNFPQLLYQKEAELFELTERFLVQDHQYLRDELKQKSGQFLWENLIERWNLFLKNFSA